MTMNKEFHPRSDIARLYVSRKNGRIGLIESENRVKSEANSLGWYVKNNIEPLLVAVRVSWTITHEEIVDPKEFKKTKEEQIENEWTAKRMHGKFARGMEDKGKITRGYDWEKVIWKDEPRLWYVVPRNSLNGLTISGAIVTKLPSHPFIEWCVVQERRLYLI